MVTNYVATNVTASIGSFASYLDNVNVGGASADMVDVTKQSSAADWREKLSGLKDGGQVTLTVHYDPDDATIPVLGQAAATLTIDWGGTLTYSATVLVQNISIVANLGEKIVADITLEVTGAVNFGA